MTSKKTIKYNHHWKDISGKSYTSVCESKKVEIVYEDEDIIKIIGFGGFIYSIDKKNLISIK